MVAGRGTGKRLARALAVAALAAGGSGLAGQEPPAQPAASEAPPEASSPYRALEGHNIINLPSINVARAGTLTMLFTHRFQQPVQDSDIQSLFSFDSGANIGIGLWYAPVKNLEVGFYRSSELDVYEVDAKYRVYEGGAFAAVLRAGGDFRTERGISYRNNFFAQAILAVGVGQRVRVTAVPTYVSQTSGEPSIYGGPLPPPPPHDLSCALQESGLYLCDGLYEDVFNIPFAVSVAITHSISVHGEVTPRFSKNDASGVGWIVSVEKTLLRHRFAFTAGNLRTTTVDQYVRGVPYLPAGSFRTQSDVYLGFNIIRNWKLN